VLNREIAPQFDALKRGLHAVCGGPILQLFTPDELELAVCGSPHFDFAELQAVAVYDGGFTEDSNVVIWLWEVCPTPLTYCSLHSLFPLSLTLCIVKSVCHRQRD
jgi:hypothetical protein